MGKTAWLAVVLAAVLIGTAPVEAQALTVQVADSVTVNGPLLHLGDLANITGDDPAQVAAWQQLPLGPAPPPGSSVVLTDDIIRGRLVAAGQDLAGVVWQSPLQVSITTASQTVTSDALVAAARDALTAQVALPPEDVTITVRRAPPDLVLPVGQVRLAAAVPGGVRFDAPVVVPVSVQVNGAVVQQTAVTFDINGYIAVVTARRPLAAREMLGPDNVALARRNVRELPPGYFTTLSQVTGLSVRRPVAAGMILTPAVVAPPVVVHRGSDVTIVAQVNGIQVRAAGVALMDGAQGQVIRVQNVASQRILQARVVDATTVKVLAY